MTMKPYQEPLAVVGLGYVGLPLAAAFGQVRQTLGFDIDCDRVSALQHGFDVTREVSESQLKAANLLTLSCEEESLRSARIFVVAVPTPIDSANRPDLGPLKAASEMVGRALSSGALVIFESTVYPGATEEVCVPILERSSGLKLNRDFTVGYSPERINPGDREHTLATVVKVVSGSTPEALDAVDALYREVVPAGTFRAQSIQVAEAAKVIENVQRDVNIALVNELSILFDRLGLDTKAVLDAAGSKWNFLPFTPGLVGGHCIGVDPYYLTHRAQEVGYHPEIVLAGRRINDSMGSHVADRVVLLLAQRSVALASARVLILGLAFKENCPDTRNTKVTDVVKRLMQYGISTAVADPWVADGDAVALLGFPLSDLASVEVSEFDAVILAVPHPELVEFVQRWAADTPTDTILFDVKRALYGVEIDGGL